MQILHGAIDKGCFCLWLECKVDLESLKKPRGRKPAHPPPKLHPFSQDFEKLSHILSLLSVKEKDLTKALIFLPSLEKGPLPSTNILGSIPFDTKREKPQLASWVVPTVVLKPKEALFFLLKEIKNKEFAKEVLLGKEFVFLTALAEFVLSLIVRQRYIPTISNEELHISASWMPIFLGQDKQRLSQLKSAFPPCCRALSLSLKQKSPPLQNLEIILEEFIAKGIQAFTCLEEDELKNRANFNNTHDSWLYALRTKDPIFQVSENENSFFVQAATEWHQPLKNQTQSPFKFCFRLEEPNQKQKEDVWKVSYLLQAYDDPSLLITTNDIWNPKGAKRKVLRHADFKARQFILGSLGMALGVCEAIKSSLETQIPNGFPLDSEGAFQFLDQNAPQLEELGFGVICPNWWNKKKMTLSARAFVQSPFKHQKKESIWDGINTDWGVFLGKQKVSLQELQELVRLKTPLINMRGEWVVIRREEMQKALKFLQNPHQPKNLIDLLQIDAGIPEKAYGIPIEGLEATGWIKDFLKALKNEKSFTVIDQPKGFKGTLRPYQVRGYSWMTFLQEWGIGACLADDMGLGKTLQTLALVMRDFEQKETTKPSLLVCPTSLLGNWARESAKFVPDLPVHIHHGAQRENDPSNFQKGGLVVTSYALLHRDLEFLEKIKWRGIILDEAQNVKNAETKQAKASHQLDGDYRFALTGTPVENNVGDLWSIMHFLNPGYLGSQESFRSFFFKPIQAEKNVEALENLKRLTKPFILRRLKTDRSIITDLPDKIETNSYCSLTSEQISLYESVVQNANNLLQTVEGIERKGVILSTLGKLKQICNHPLNFLKDRSEIKGRSGKLQRLEELLEEMDASRDRSLIFTQYTEMGHLLKNYLQEMKGKEVLFLHGGVRKNERDLMVQRFQQEDRGVPSVFILSIKAGGVGLNLTQANQVIHFDRWWNPAVENQATDRAFRIGQKKKVQVHKFICPGTIEERIDAMIESKKEIAQSAIGQGEKWLTELSNESLKELWQLQTTLVV